jgi:hypothetical protein
MFCSAHKNKKEKLKNKVSSQQIYQTPCSQVIRPSATCVIEVRQYKIRSALLQVLSLADNTKYALRQYAQNVVEQYGIRYIGLAQGSYWVFHVP